MNKELLAQVTQKNLQQGGDPPVAAKRKTLDVLFDSRKVQFGQALAGSGISPDRFCRIMITEIAGSATLTRILADNPASILGACMEMAQLGLDPAVPNEAFLVPYGNTATCQTGYKGLAKLAKQSAAESGSPLVLLRNECIYSNDVYERTLGDSPTVTHRPPPFGEDRGKVIGYYAISRDSSGLFNHREMTVAQVQEHKRRFSKAKSGPFADPANFDAYGLKTVLRQLISKDLPMSAKLSRAIAIEDAVSNGSEITNAPDIEIVAEEVPKESSAASSTIDCEPIEVS